MVPQFVTNFSSISSLGNWIAYLAEPPTPFCSSYQSHPVPSLSFHRLNSTVYRGFLRQLARLVLRLLVVSLARRMKAVLGAEECLSITLATLQERSQESRFLLFASVSSYM